MLLAVLVLSLLSAFVWHSIAKRFAVAVAASAATSWLFSWALSAGHFGMLDRDFVVNSLVVLLVSSVVAGIVGVLPMFRRRRAPSSHAG